MRGPERSGDLEPSRTRRYSNNTRKNSTHQIFLFICCSNIYSARRGARCRWHLFSTDRRGRQTSEIRTRLSTGGTQTTHEKSTLQRVLSRVFFERETGLEDKNSPQTRIKSRRKTHCLQTVYNSLYSPCFNLFEILSLYLYPYL